MRRLWAIVPVAAVLVCLAGHRPATANRKPLDLVKQQAIQQLNAMPIAFEANVGQTAADASFVARGQGYTMWATTNGPVLRLGNPRAARREATVRLRVVGGAPTGVPTPDGLLPGRANYFIGNDPARWRTGVPRFAGLRYQRVYPGIDLVLHGTQESLEYDFDVAPYADPSQIAVSFDGATDVRIEPDGDLTLSVNGGELSFHAPVAYQERNGTRNIVSARYEAGPDHEMRFAVGDYDHTRPLVIDPVLAYSTYLGGTKKFFNLNYSVEDAYGIAVDAAGNAYLTGFTNAVDFPATPGSLDNTCAGCSNSGGDAWVAKIDPSLSGAASLVYCTYLGAGGTGSSIANAIAADNSGNVYVTGWTSGFDDSGTAANEGFPTTANAFQPNDGLDLAVSDAFLTKLNATGSSLLYSTYLGGTNVDEGWDVKADDVGNVVVVGRSSSPTFPEIKNAFQPTSKGGFDAFVVKFDTTASGAASLKYGTLLGGSSSDAAGAVAVDALGRIYVTGDTQSTQAVQFPTLNGFQTTGAGGQDAFMAEIDPNAAGAASLLYSTLVGGDGTEGAFVNEGGIAVDPAGLVYITGSTYGASLNKPFPTTQGAYRSTPGQQDAYVVKINPSIAGASSLVASTLLGGSFFDTGSDITIDGFGNPVVVGSTESSDFALAGCGVAKHAGRDAFVVVLNPSLTAASFATTIGGDGTDKGYGVGLGPQGAIYLAGGTDSNNFPVTANAFDTTPYTQCNGCASTDAFLTVIAAGFDVCPAPPAAANQSASTPEDTPLALTLAATDSNGNNAPPDTLTWTVTAPPAHGTLDVASGTMTHGVSSAYSAFVNYAPVANYSGPDSFQFKVNDGTTNSNTATVSINVTPVNDAPAAGPDAATTQEDTAVVVNVLANDADAEGDALSVAGAACDNGAGVVINADQTLKVTPASNFNGSLACTYAVSDGKGGTSSGQLIVTVTPVNDNPVAAPDTAATNDNMLVTIAVLANDSDPDGDVVTLTSADSCQQGTVMANGDGTITYTPKPNFGGVDVCQYSVSDGQGGVATGQVTITVTKVNQPPLLDNPGDQLTEEGTAVSLQLNASDPDGELLTFTAAGLPPGLAIDANGLIAGAPASGSAGSYSVSATVDDGHGGTTTVTFLWVVTVAIAENQPPVCTAAQPSLAAIWPADHSLVPIQILGVTDPDGGQPAITITRILQDEPTNTFGDGSTWIDGFGVGTATAQVRAERAGSPKVPGDGRVYEIFFTATDSHGATCGGSVIVTVPRDQNGAPAIDSLVRYDSTVAGGQPIIKP